MSVPSPEERDPFFTVPNISDFPDTTFEAEQLLRESYEAMARGLALHLARLDRLTMGTKPTFAFFDTYAPMGPDSSAVRRTVLVTRENIARVGSGFRVLVNDEVLGETKDRLDVKDFIVSKDGTKVGLLETFSTREPFVEFWEMSWIGPILIHSGGRLDIYKSSGYKPLTPKRLKRNDFLALAESHQNLNKLLTVVAFLDDSNHETNIETVTGY